MEFDECDEYEDAEYDNYAARGPGRMVRASIA
jgi:hypothetical protein